MLLRHGYLYREGRNWTLKHKAWVKRVRFELPELQAVLNNYLLAVEQIEERIKHLEGRLEEAAQSEEYAQRVGWLRCLRGVDTITALVLLSELHEPQRFATPRALMAYLGLTPSEYSSGTQTKRGSITKAGNAHVRRVLVEAAWNYRHRPGVSSSIAKRRKGQPEAVLAIADQAQLRLHKRYYTLKEGHRKHHNVVTVRHRQGTGGIHMGSAQSPRGCLKKRSNWLVESGRMREGNEQAKARAGYATGSLGFLDSGTCQRK